MARLYYDEYKNKYYNPDEPYKPGVNKNWLDIQRGFHRIATEQLETEQGLTLGLGTDDETSLTAAELKELKQGGGPLFTHVTKYEDETEVYLYDFGKYNTISDAPLFFVEKYIDGLNLGTDEKLTIIKIKEIDDEISHSFRLDENGVTEVFDPVDVKWMIYYSDSFVALPGGGITYLVNILYVGTDNKLYQFIDTPI